MLLRLRQAARRFPGLCLGLLLLAFSSQSLAATLDWCLHAGEGAHVANGLVPCDDHAASTARGATPVAEGPSAGAPQGGGMAAPPVDGTAAPCRAAGAGSTLHPMHRVVASSDGASLLADFGLALPPAAPWQFLPRDRSLEVRGDDAIPRPGREPGPGSGAARPALSGAVPGQSSRLRI
jgi:hypothetical protein